MQNEVKKLPYEETGILPVINIPTVEVALPLAEALMKGGLYALEVTLRSECSLEAIKLIKETYPEMVIGAGTVLSTETVDAAIAAGVDFIVTPGSDYEVIDYCIEKGILIVPGCVTPSEIQASLKRGLTTLKFFPAELNGGIDTINLISGPFPSAKFIPTGGINYKNLGTYLRSKKILACGGSYMATADQIKNGDFEAITAACKKAVDISLGFELAHIGVKCGDEESAKTTAETIADVFRMQPRYMNSAVFAGTAVEAVKSSGYGQHGHVGFFTNSIPRAIAYFKNKGIALNEDSIKRNVAGEITCIYLKDDIGGFAFHVVAR